jgi:type II secretory pathway component PulF
MKSEHPISLRKDGRASADAIAAAIAQFKEENEALRRLATLLRAQLNLARTLRMSSQQPSH